MLDKFESWLDGDFKAKKIPAALSITSVLTLREAFSIRRGFSQKQQAQFLMHFLSIQGQKDKKENVEVLTIMNRLYQDSDAIGVARLIAVSKLLLERTKEGLQLHRAMADIFSSSFTMIIRAAASTSQSESADAQENLNIAIKQATFSAIEVAKVQRSVRFKMVASILSLWGSMVAAKKGSEYYLALKAENPEIDRFIDIPHNVYLLGNFVVDYSYLSLAIIISAYLTIRWLNENWVNEKRMEWDQFFPPFIIYKYISGLNVFSGLTLLISYVQYESSDAIKVLGAAATKYERYHLQLMSDRLSEGRRGTEQLDTGLLPKQLRLTLQIAGEGGATGVREALEVVNAGGRSLILKALSYTSTFILVVCAFISGLTALMVGAASAFLFQASLGI
ncbi:MULTISPECIES: hypothetical protein [Vibrio]|uniref:Type II secretion system protein GspF domain-containing protein n=2 Tax=Vibrio TaxID=662 RepID=A0A2N7NND6_9VIBR|nr:hypothetical protein [Vibrio tasmaniensis]PMO80313.1 hypothetical protein BCT01_08460 [Vibrio tasmaniensis]PMP17819.1 hypothetical protein BCS92_05270 [Vibrio tasmaniensis]TKG29024.1 hypothetical protein FC057_20270 [Vibrio tasmaniensis]TKG41577.1 hypothetical protein FC063_06880 [Vibrio tasmaniensis]TKG46226.1 hypothetical protein FC070_22345 [Vibrio tasmaniensis]